MRYALVIALLALACGAPTHGQEQARPVADEARVLAGDLRQLTGQAGLIFKGVVSGIGYETNTETDIPYTLVTFRQIEPIKDLSGRLSEDATLTIKLFGGLHESGTMTIASHVPDILLGAVYVVFYTAGEWSISPIVGSDAGLFRVVKSRSLNMDLVIDYNDRIVVSVVNEVLRSVPQASVTAASQRQAMPQKRGEAKATQEEQPIEIEKDSIYSEQNVRRMMEGEEPAVAKSEGPAVTPVDRAEILRQLPSSPMSAERFIKAIKDVDDRYRHEFADKYSQVYFDPVPLKKERKPAAPNR